MFFVYALYNKRYDKIYIGQTENLENRILFHNNNAFKGSYTSRFEGEWILIYKESFQTRHDALIREKQLKSYRGREYIKAFIP